KNSSCRAPSRSCFAQRDRGRNVMKTLMMIAAVLITADAAWAAGTEGAVLGGGPGGQEPALGGGGKPPHFRQGWGGCRWAGEENCPAGALKVEFLMDSRFAGHDPKALAYAMPYEKTHMVVFLDRVRAVAEPNAVRFVLAYVLLHEITHMLEGMARHSETGIMK